MAELVRVAALTGYFETAAEFSVDPRPLLKEQGLSPNQLVNPEQLLPARAVIRLLERTAQEAGSITFGLRMAESRSLADLGAVSLLIAHQPTLRGALKTLFEYRARINSTLVLTMEEIGDDVIVREEFSFRQPEPARQSTSLTTGVLARICRSVLGASWQPRTVCFSHDVPPREDLAVYHRLFGHQIAFNCEFDGIVLRARDLDRHNLAADARLAGHASKLLSSVLSPADYSTSQNVDQTIRLLLPAGKATIQNCAASLGMTVRTLQRALDAEGRSFTGLLNEARMQLASQYLDNQRLRVTDIAEILGYNSIGAFTRWHTATFGMPPSARRQERQSGSKGIV